MRSKRILKRPHKAGSGEEQHQQSHDPGPAFRLSGAGCIEHLLDGVGAGRADQAYKLARQTFDSGGPIDN